MSLSKTLKLTKQWLFISQEEFTKAIHVSIAPINRWKNNRAKPNLTARKNIKNFCKSNELPFNSIEEKQQCYSSKKKTNN